jgi:ABC-type branched-subunit amino acid transport system ATPase component
LPRFRFLSTQLGKTAFFNMTDGVYHSEITGIEAVVPTIDQIKKSRVVSVGLGTAFGAKFIITGL